MALERLHPKETISCNCLFDHRMLIFVACYDSHDNVISLTAKNNFFMS